MERKPEEVRVRHKRKEDKSSAEVRRRFFGFEVIFGGFQGSRSHSKDDPRERPDEERRANKTLADLRER